MSARNYYCSNKFKFLKLDLERQLSYTCHAAYPQNIDFSWLENNQGELFNIPINVLERQQMLDNVRTVSCEQNCWPAEDQGKTSVRILENTLERTHTNLHVKPEILDLTIDSDCNLSCVYCCKEFSSAWRREIERTGPYVFPVSDIKLVDRYHLDKKDIILSALSQQQRQSSKRYQQLLQEVDLMLPTLKKLFLSGGEPFLSTQLIDILTKAKDVPYIKLFTGLGISTTRLEKVLQSLPRLDNLEVTISGEGVGGFYEFSRYGNTYSKFQDNIALLEKYNIKFKFHSTISNLTVHGFLEFYNTYQPHDFEIDFAYTPGFLSPNVIDPVSKQELSEKLLQYNTKITTMIAKSIQPDFDSNQRQNLAAMLDQLKQRRTINLNIFPKHFLDWIYS